MFRIAFSSQHAIQGRSFYSPAVLKLKCGYSIAHQQGNIKQVFPIS